MVSLAVQHIDTPVAAATNLGSIYRLADHLDATLAMGEDLLRQKLDVTAQAGGDAHAAITRRQDAISAFARTLRALELGITSRLLQARTRAAEVKDVHPQFALLLGLFIGGTAPLADAAAGRDGGLGDITPSALMSGPQVLTFLVTRGLVAPELQALSTLEKLASTEDYLLAERIHLGTLMDMVAQTLESLDLAFDLYAEPRKGDGD